MIGYLSKKYFNKHRLSVEEYRERVLKSINILIEICDIILEQKRQKLRYNYRNNLNNQNNRGAVYGNNNRNNLNNNSTKKQTHPYTLQKQRKAFIERIVKNPNGSPLNKHNFPNKNS